TYCLDFKHKFSFCPLLGGLGFYALFRNGTYITMFQPYHLWRYHTIDPGGMSRNFHGLSIALLE
ncbi:hypothetical protein, partial [Pseudoflavonifractor sp. An176]|uniref:hypothetical protein n=1 Tax=Pseudoflavonifractor sp. An176 TaxID=1965572 RepID=UPI00194F9A23